MRVTSKKLLSTLKHYTLLKYCTGTAPARIHVPGILRMPLTAIYAQATVSNPATVGL